MRLAANNFEGLVVIPTIGIAGLLLFVHDLMSLTVFVAYCLYAAYWFKDSWRKLHISASIFILVSISFIAAVAFFLSNSDAATFKWFLYGYACLAIFQIVLLRWILPQKNIDKEN